MSGFYGNRGLFCYEAQVIELIRHYQPNTQMIHVFYHMKEEEGEWELWNTAWTSSRQKVHVIYNYHLASWTTAPSKLYSAMNNTDVSWCQFECIRLQDSSLLLFNQDCWPTGLVEYRGKEHSVNVMTVLQAAHTSSFYAGKLNYSTVGKIENWLQGPSPACWCVHVSSFTNSLFIIFFGPFPTSIWNII